MIELSFTVNTQVLARTDSNTLASNSRQVHQCSFDFSSEWDSMEKVATFKKNGIVYNVMLENDACIVPNEVLIDEKYSVFAVAVYGTNGAKTITSTAVIIPVLSGSNTDGVETEITPSMFEQIMGKILEIEQGEVSPEAVADAVNDYMEQHPIDALTEQECVNLIAAYFLDHKNELKGDPGEPGAAGVTPIISATAEVGATVGTPSVTVTKSGTTEAPNFNFNFQNLKGEQGNPGSDGVTPIITANATVDNTSGNPSVVVTKSGTDASPVFNFAFTGLKGEAGQGGSGSAVVPVISASATVDNTTGTPAVTVTKSGTDAAPSFAFAFSNLKGAKGDPGTPGPSYDDTSIQAAIQNLNQLVGTWLTVSGGGYVYSAIIGDTSATFVCNLSGDVMLEPFAETNSGDVIPIKSATLNNGTVTVTFDELEEAASLACRASVLPSSNNNS